MVCSLCRHCRKTSSAVGMKLRACRNCSVTGWNGKGEHVLGRGNPPAEPALIPEGRTNNVLLRHAEPSNRGSAGDLGKRYRANRGVVRPGRWTFWYPSPPGYHMQCGGCRQHGNTVTWRYIASWVGHASRVTNLPNDKNGNRRVFKSTRG